MLKHLFALALVLSAWSGASASAIYSTDFESAPAEWSGSGVVVPTFGNKYWANDSAAGSVAGASVLTFTSGTAVAGASLSLLLGIIDTWDNGAAGYGPDSFKVELDGVEVFSAVFDNYQNLGATVASELTTVSYGSNLIGSGANDAAYKLSVNLGALSAGTHTLKFFASGPGWQGGSDESFALDNLSITAVPEPQTWGLALAGALALGVTRRLRAQR